VSEEDKAKKILRDLVKGDANNPESPFSDMRLPPRDPFAALASWQMRRHDVEALRKEIITKWPEVEVIDVGVCNFSNKDTIEFDLQSKAAPHPINQRLMKIRQELTEWVAEHCPQAAPHILFAFLGVLDRDRIRGSQTIYDKEQPERVAGIINKG